MKTSKRSTKPCTNRLLTLSTLNKPDAECVVRYVAELWDRVGRLERQVLAMEIGRRKRG